MNDCTDCTIPYGEMPGFPNLFLDYISEFENVSPFYKHNFRNTDSYPELFKSICRHSSKQAETAALIEEQYRDYLASGKTRDNIAALKKPNTIAIVTGQQLGMLGGPLYTIYKTFTAIKLAEELRIKHPAFNFVPVFWLEGEDHDFEEVRHVTLPDPNGGVKKISYGLLETIDEEKSSVGGIKITPEIEQFLDEVKASLRGTEFTQELLDAVTRYYEPGKTFVNAFRDLLFFIFDRYGLVIFNPSDPEAKKIVQAVFLKEIQEFRAHTVALIERSAELENVYHAQVKVRPVNLFYNLNGKRFAVEPDDEGGFRLRKKRVKFTPDELLREASEHPERFSPNVLLRPICQDTLFNTGFYIAGPAEVSYFAQVMPLYDFFSIPAPVIFPRASVTLLEKHLSDSLQKNKLKLQNLFLDEKELHDLLISHALPFNLNDLFTATEKEVVDAIAKLQATLIGVDKTTADGADRYKVKMIAALAEYKNKAIEAEKRKQETVIRQSQKLLNAVYPEGKLQERSYNFLAYANRYGLSVLDKIYAELSVTQFEHQVIIL
jgi:bacillithiol biosynthesis cysteine-adding enzyme BshC